MKFGLKISLFILMALAELLDAKTSFAQQDPMYTQYMDNLLILNPGYAGASENGNLLLVSRNQWVSLPNAPVTRSFSYNTPVKNKNIGLGFSVMYDKTGPQKQAGIYFDYAYFLKLSDKYKMGMGLKGGVSFYRASLTDLVTISPDPIYSQDIYRNFLPNFGVGTYIYSDKSYFGISVPKLIQNTITRDDYQTQYVNREKIHLYIVAGKQFNLGEDISLKTSAMLKYVQNTPISYQETVMFGFREKIWLGGMYRMGDSFGFIAKFEASDKLQIGYSYDITTSALNVFGNGTHEIMLGYRFDLF